MSKSDENVGGKTALSSLPKVDRLLKNPKVEDLTTRYSKTVVTQAIRDALSVTRNRMISGEKDIKVSEPSLVSLIEDWLINLHSPSLVPVINATGVVLHTNLGRAPLSREALENIVKVASGYSNLEFDLKKGERGLRYDHVAGLISEITGSEGAIIVNNNAAAVFLALNTLAQKREVIVSRGELVEIGGWFRIPDVMERSGAKLVEVGTTNRTRLSDYENAICSETAMILKVHTSNYRIVGFTEDVPAYKLSELAKKHKIHMMEDLGSGCLIDLARYGLPKEPTVGDTIKVGVDIVTFSGDKLLGGGQAGFIVGKKDIVEKLSKNPLNRVLRIDKLTLAACEATLLTYRDMELAAKRIPTLSMITMPYEETKKRAIRITRKINQVPHPGFDVITTDDFSQAGGGSFPSTDIPTKVVSIIPLDISPKTLEGRLRSKTPPIIARIAQERIIIDPRTIGDEQIPALVSGILGAFQADD